MKFKKIIFWLLWLLVISLFIPFVNTKYTSPKNPSIMNILSKNDTDNKLSKIITYENGILFVFLFFVLVFGFIYVNSWKRDKSIKFILFNLILLVSLMILVCYSVTRYYILSIGNYFSGSWGFNLWFYGLLISLLGLYIYTLIDFVKKYGKDSGGLVYSQSENQVYNKIDRNRKIEQNVENDNVEKNELENINPNKVINDNVSIQNNQKVIESWNNDSNTSSKLLISEEQKEKMKETFDKTKEKSLETLDKTKEKGLEIFKKTRIWMLAKKEDFAPKVNKVINDLRTKDYKSILEQNKDYVDLWKKIILPIIVVVVLYFLGMYVYNSMYYNYIPKKWDILINSWKKVKSLTYYNILYKKNKLQSLLVNWYDPDNIFAKLNSNLSNDWNNDNSIDSHGFTDQVGIDGGYSSNSDVPDKYWYVYLKTTSWDIFNNISDENDYKTITKNLLKDNLNFNYDIDKEKHTVFMYVSSLKDNVNNLYSMEIFKKLNWFTKQNTILSMISYTDNKDSRISLNTFLSNSKSVLSNFNISDLKFIINWIEEWMNSSYDYLLLLSAVDKEKNKYSFRFKIDLLKGSDDKFFTKLNKKICGFVKSNKPDEVNKLKCNVDVSKKDIEWEISFLLIK